VVIAQKVSRSVETGYIKVCLEDFGRNMAVSGGQNMDKGAKTATYPIDLQ